MYFNHFQSDYASATPSFGSFPVMNQMRPWSWPGARMNAMSQFLGNWFMSQCAAWMGGCGWPSYPQSPWYGRGDYGHAARWPANPVPVPVPVPMPVPVPVNTTPVTPAPTPAPAPAPAIVAPREGLWDASKGGYIVGQSGEVQVTYKTTNGNSALQYRASGGEWTELKERWDAPITVSAPPNSKIEFRIRNGNDKNEVYRAGSTQNVDGKDHGRVTATGAGYRLGFDEWRNDDGDYDDFIVDLTDPKARG